MKEERKFSSNNNYNNNYNNNKTFNKKENITMQKSISPLDVKQETIVDICIDSTKIINTEKYQKNLSYDKALTANWKTKQDVRDAAADIVPKEFKSSHYIKLDAGSGIVEVPGTIIKNDCYGNFTVQVNISYEVDGQEVNYLSVGNKMLCHNQLISCYLGGNVIKKDKNGGKGKDKKKSGREVMVNDSVVIVVDKYNTEKGRIKARI